MATIVRCPMCGRDIANYMGNVLRHRKACLVKRRKEQRRLEAEWKKQHSTKGS